MNNNQTNWAIMDRDHYVDICQGFPLDFSSEPLGCEWKRHDIVTATGDVHTLFTPVNYHDFIIPDGFGVVSFDEETGCWTTIENWSHLSQASFAQLIPETYWLNQSILVNID